MQDDSWSLMSSLVSVMLNKIWHIRWYYNLSPQIMWLVGTERTHTNCNMWWCGNVRQFEDSFEWEMSKHSAIRRFGEWSHPKWITWEGESQVCSSNCFQCIFPAGVLCKHLVFSVVHWGERPFIIVSILENAGTWDGCATDKRLAAPVDFHAEQCLWNWQLARR